MFFIEFQYAYFILTIPFLLIWSLFYIFSKNTRKEQLIMSAIFTPIGPLLEIIYFKDYWLPESILSFNLGAVPILVEDLLFAFAIGGIGAIIYEALFHRRLSEVQKLGNGKINIFVIILLAGMATYSFLSLGINSIYATSLGFLCAAVLIVLERNDLLVDSLVSGITVMLTMMASYFVLSLLISNVDDIFRQGWLLYGTALDQRFFGDIPLTEMVWGFSVGLFLGPLYEFGKNFKVAR